MRYAHRLMAAVYAMTGESDKAALSMHIGAGAAPSWTDPWLADVIKRRTGYDALLDRIRDLTDTGRNDEAVALVNQLLADRPDDLALLNFLGYAHVNAGRRTQGIEIWQDALQRHPDSYLLHLNLGSLGAEDALRAGVPTDDAMRHLDTAITLNPAHARSFEVRGTLHAILGNTANAIDDLERAFALDPTAPNVARQLTQLYLRESRWTDAERVLQRWMLLEPGSPQARLSFAITLMNQDRFDEARQAINEGAQMLPPDHPQVRALREELDRRRHR